MGNYSEQLQKWRDCFYCNECGCNEISDFGYSRTTSTGEVWICKNCKNEIVVENKPNEY